MRALAIMAVVGGVMSFFQIMVLLRVPSPMSFKLAAFA
jgi:hypothetical protein